jgi:enolase-phosphatase E1
MPPPWPDPRPEAILTDIEGTTTPIAFVRDVLFPYARARLPDFLARHADHPLVAEARALAGGRPVLDALLAWMDQDAKVTPLKAMQGLIWNQGYRDGALRGRIYPDVPPALRGWHATGLRLAVYSSGSEAAQRLIFGHSDAGDLAALFTHFFDTRIGGKREAASYAAIATTIGAAPDHILFLSDIEQELDAARLAGLRTCQIVRPQDGTVASTRHRTAPSFATLAKQLS